MPAEQDLAGRIPGQALLEQIARYHRAATEKAASGEPGVLDAEIVPWCVGFIGEEQVAAALATLPAPWRVLQSVPVGVRDSDIDHVVVGPPGIVTINAKHHQGARVDVRGDAVIVGAQYQHYVRNARGEAAHARTAVAALGLDVASYPVVCIVGGRVNVKEASDGVTVLPLPELIGWLLALPRRLDDAQAQTVYEHLRVASAWGRADLPPPPEPWVAELARGLATEHRMARQAPAHRTLPAVDGSGPQGRRRASRSRPRLRRPTRGRVTARRLEVVRAAVLLAVLAVAVAWLYHSLGSLPTNAPYRDTSPKPAVKAGQSCTTKDATTKRDDGTVLVCRSKGAKKVLAWQLKVAR